MRSYWISGLAAVLAAAPALAAEPRLRDLATDRPDKTESPITVDGGHVQIEMDFVTYTRDRSRQGRVEQVSAAPLNLKLGIGHTADLQLLVEPYLSRREQAAAGGRRANTSGFGDVTVRYKQNLVGDDGGRTAVALMPFVTLPTAARGLGVDRMEGGLIVPVSTKVFGLDLGLMSEIDLVSDGRKYIPSAIHSATLGFDLGPQWGLYTEVYTEQSFAQRAATVVTFDAGLTFRPAADIQFDLGVNLGVTSAADDVMAFVGLSRRF